jgi:transcriptional regulator with XRE-family HTH domain
MAQVIGTNVRELRLAAKVTLDAFALVARQYGLPWTSGRVGDLESGRVLPNLETIYAVAAALSHATGQPVTLADLLSTDQPVAINDQLCADAEQLRAALTGHPVTGVCEDYRTFGAKVETFLALREADWRLCKQLGINREYGAAVMGKLWGHTFSDERDRRAGSDANAQRRGQISRQLKAQLEEAISDGTH